MLSNDRNTLSSETALMRVPVAASVRIYTGALVVANASGYAAPGSTAADLTYLGRAEEGIDNTSGLAGAETVKVRRDRAFKWKNSGSDLVTQASLGKPCYIVDDETVAATDGTGTRSAAGVVLRIDSDGVWVD